MEEEPPAYLEKLQHPALDAFLQQTTSYKNGYYRVQPYGMIFPKSLLKFDERIRRFQIEETDVWIATSIKCGTRWMQEMVWCLRNGLDLVKAKQADLDDRVPFFEMSAIDPLNKYETDSFKSAHELKSPRTFKTHLAYHLLPRQLKSKGKIINVIRNPRDVAVSTFNHWRILEKYTGTFEQLCEVILNNVGTHFGPFFPHVLSYWKHKEDKNILIVSYEDMQRDLPDVIRKVASFLDILVSEDDGKMLAEHLSFKNMKANPRTNYDAGLKRVKEIQGNTMEGSMLNKGETGRWREFIKGPLLQRFEDWEQSWLKDTDLKFGYEL